MVTGRRGHSLQGNFKRDRNKLRLVYIISKYIESLLDVKTKVRSPTKMCSDMNIYIYICVCFLVPGVAAQTTPYAFKPHKVVATVGRLQLAGIGIGQELCLGLSGIQQSSPRRPSSKAINHF